MASDISQIDVSIITIPNDLGAVPELMKSLQGDLDMLKSGGEAVRQDMLIRARTLMQALETPRETMMKHCFAQASALAGLSLGVETGLWKLMARSGDRPQRVEDLAQELGVDVVLLGRFMRHLSSMGYIKEAGMNKYQTTNFSKAMSIPLIGDAYLVLPSATGAAHLRFHEYARKRGFKNTDDARDTPLMYAYNTDMNMFEWVQSLGYGPHFNNFMGGYQQGRAPWMGPCFFPVRESLFEGASDSPNAPFLVDIGGGTGHELNRFKQYHPSHPGRLILQDLPVVLGQISELDPSIQRMEYDFFTEQPIKGARAYCIHNCLHDWPDEDCKRILGRIKQAMKPGYSKLLVGENVVTEQGAWWETSALDITMLTFFNAKERTTTDWYNLIEHMVGLKIVKIWSPGKGTESLIEVELPQTCKL